jgi:hypothetical protein
MMRCSKYILFYSLLCFCFCSCAQTRKAIINIYATYTVRMPGNMAVDEKGNYLSKADTLITVYVDAKEEIKWEKAWRNEKEYSIITQLLPSSTEVGVQPDNEKLIIQANKGNKLWQLRLIPGENKSLPPVTLIHNQILLIGEYNGKKITQIISEQTELVRIPSV